MAAGPGRGFTHRADTIAKWLRERQRDAANSLEIQERNPISWYRCILKHQRMSLIEQHAERMEKSKW